MTGRFYQSRFDQALEYAGGWTEITGRPDQSLSDKLWYLEAVRISASVAGQHLTVAGVAGDIATKNAAYWKADLWLRVCELAVTCAVEGISKPEGKPEDGALE